MTHSISLIAPAKLNLNLSVKEKLKNGYHSLESDVCFLALHDVINIEISNLNKIKISDKSTFILKDESILLKTLNCFNSEFKNENKFIYIEPTKTTLEIDFEIKFKNQLIGNQRNKVNVYENDLSDIYNYRTFCDHVVS